MQPPDRNHTGEQQEQNSPRDSITLHDEVLEIENASAKPSDARIQGEDVVSAHRTAPKLQTTEMRAQETDIEKSGHVDESIAKADPKLAVLQDQSNLLPTKQVIICFLALGSALFLAILDQTLVATALPTITEHFNGGSDAIWIATAYLVTSTAFQPLAGRFSDIFGRKPLLLGAMLVFTVFSLACGLAQTLIQLIIFRALAGIGGAAIATLCLIVISDIVSLERRGKFQGILGGVIAIAQGIGPILGSVFSEKVTWRWAFYINVPIGAVAILICAFVLPLKKVTGDMKTKLKQVDYGGSALVLAGVILVLVALNYGGQELPWDAALVLSTLIIGLALIFFLFLYEWKIAKLPIIPLATFRNRTILGVYYVTFALGAANFVPLFYVPQFYQIVKGYSSINAGVMLLPLLIIQVTVSWLSGLLVQKTGRTRPSIIVGYCVWSIGSGLLSSVDEQTPKANVIGYLILSGFGAGQCFQTSLVLAQAAAEKREMASVTGMRNFVRTLAGTLALAIASSVVNNSLRSKARSLGLSPEVEDAIAANPRLISASNTEYSLSPQQHQELGQSFTRGIQISYYIVTAFLVLAALVSIFVLQHHTLVRESDAQAKADAKVWLAERKEKRHRKHCKEEEKSEGV